MCSIKKCLTLGPVKAFKKTIEKKLKKLVD